MQFTFWCVLADGRQLPIDTNNLFEARRGALALSAVTCFCRNPGTGVTTALAF